MSNFRVSDRVRYSDHFCKSVGAFTYDESTGNTAEIASIRGRVARLRWGDGSETSALLSNLSPAVPHIPKSSHDPLRDAEREKERALLLLDAAIAVKTAWANGEPERAASRK